jgi:hypothetical protein
MMADIVLVVRLMSLVVFAVGLAFAEPRFLLRHADPELQTMLEQTVPPVDLSLIAIFRTPIAKYQKQARSRF